MAQKSPAVHPDPCQPPEQAFPDIRTQSKRNPQENLHHSWALLGVCRALGDKTWTNIICQGSEGLLQDAGRSLANGWVRTGIVSNAERVRGAQTGAGSPGSQITSGPHKASFRRRGAGGAFPAQAAPELSTEAMLQTSPEPGVELLIQAAPPPIFANPPILDPFVLTPAFLALWTVVLTITNEAGFFHSSSPPFSSVAKPWAMEEKIWFALWKLQMHLFIILKQLQLILVEHVLCARPHAGCLPISTPHSNPWSGFCFTSHFTVGQTEEHRGEGILSTSPGDEWQSWALNPGRGCTWRPCSEPVR